MPVIAATAELVAELATLARTHNLHEIVYEQDGVRLKLVFGGQHFPTTTDTNIRPPDFKFEEDEDEGPYGHSAWQPILDVDR